MSSVELSVIAPCLNEEANLSALYERLFAAVEAAGIDTELILVDDGSTDGTWDTIAALAHASQGKVRGVRHDENRGIAASWRSGIDAAAGRLACFIDADLQNPPEQVVTLYRRLLESRADIAQGTRSSIERLRDSRLTFSRGLNLLLNLAFRTWATDSKSGFVLAPTPVMKDVVSYRGPYRYFQTFISVAAKAKGYSVLEVETLFQSRFAGTSFLSARTVNVSLGALADFPRAIAEFGVRRHPHGASIGPRTAPPERPQHPYGGWRRLSFEAYFATMPLARLEDRASHARALPGAQAIGVVLEGRARRAPAPKAPAPRTARLCPRAALPRRDAGLRASSRPPSGALDDIARLPLLSKHDVRRGLYFDLFADDHDKRRMQRISTSGSDRRAVRDVRRPVSARVSIRDDAPRARWTGWRFGDRQARLWHQTIGMSRLEVLARTHRRVVHAPTVRPGVRDGTDELEGFVRKIREHRPVLVDGYAESFDFSPGPQQRAASPAPPQGDHVLRPDTNG